MRAGIEGRKNLRLFTLSLSSRIKGEDIYIL